MDYISSMFTFGKRLLEAVPEVDGAFAYGSGVFFQPDLYTHMNQPQVDFVFIVSDPLQWHSQNWDLNPNHYSGLARLGPKMVMTMSTGIGVGIHFNPFIIFENRVVKYGVVGREALNVDLMTWRYLYLSGRLHKPVLWIKKPEMLDSSLSFNRQAALCCAMLLSFPQIRIKDLYREICGLSYRGDIRMGVAEDKAKIDRIVSGSLHEFHSIYRPLIQNVMEQSEFIPHDEDVMLTINTSKCSELIACLPQLIRECISKQRDMELMKNTLRNLLATRVRRSSVRQALAGFLSSGISKSSIYLYNKIAKTFR